jgi:(2S)-methylsuccinyl-CoA dehydrogenase
MTVMTPIAPTAADDFASAELLRLAKAGLGAADRLLVAATGSVAELVRGKDGGINAKLLEREQTAAHGLAWLATYVETLRQTLHWAETLHADGKFGELEALIVRAGFGEYLAQMVGGIPMAQGELVRPRDLGIEPPDLAGFVGDPAVGELMARGNLPGVRARIGKFLEAARSTGDFGQLGLDETMAMVRDTFRKFAEAKVIPFAHDWHRKDELIPLEVYAEMAELGVFGLTVPEEYGGHGLGKTAMCVVSEELSRAYIGVGSLGTRAEIACELILRNGTPEQKSHWLPRIASGEILPTAVFTEPNTGSDLGSLRARAVREGDDYVVNGNKTWITHAARADLMTLLVRTDPAQPGYKGLSMLLAPKPRGTVAAPFPAAGMSGGEIKVLGYRGMKEYEISFDGFKVPAANLLGGSEGHGFKQLMETFESARIQTAARALGVAQSALELGLAYAMDRVQFGKPIVAFPRVHGKLAIAAVELMMARQLSYFSAREKDANRRCDLEAGMAKLLAARIAWSNADNALQIHGGNGYAEEFPISRVLCDARILNIFEGAAEIQATVIARRLLEQKNG